MICVFDIETIPDFHLLADVFELGGSPLEIAKTAQNIQKEKSGSEFLPLCFHRVISISSVICDEFGAFKRVGHFGKNFLESLESKDALDSMDKDSKLDFLSSEFLDELEKTLLQEFWLFFNKNNPKLVSFNGRGFDIPTLALRSMRYNLNAWALFEQNNQAFNKTKWENYRQRYSEQFHTDLFDSLGQFGATRSLNLHSLCKMLDLVGKYDMSGSEVYETYLGGKNTKEAKLSALETINHYCHSDVLNTYWLYLKYELLKGELLLEDYYHLLQILSEKLPQDKPYSAIFTQTLQKHISQATTQKGTK